MIYVIQRRVVARSFARLREQKTHTLFPGYLHLQQQAGRLGRLHDLRPDFLTFFARFFQVRDHPLGTPYIKPFTEQKASSKNLWLNENVAGSYAPSSLRPDKPFRQVVRIEGRKYSLPEDHATRALEHLMYFRPLPVADLAVFLYRDYGLKSVSPTIVDLIDTFAFEFGYTSEVGGSPDQSFRTLYDVDSVHDWGEDWLDTI